MELDDLKNTWDDINHQVKKQQHLNPAVIDQITRKTYHSGLKKIAYPEIAGAIICLAGATFIVLHFSKLDTTFLKAAGAVSILLLLTLPLISLASLRQLNMTVDVNKTYAATLKDFAIQKIRFHKFQRLSITLSYLLLVTTIILLSKFFNDKDITGNKFYWIFSFSIGYIFLLFYSSRVSKYYNHTLRQSEDLLKELAS